LPIDLSRRGLLGAAGLLALGPGIPLAASAQSQGKRLKVVVAGGHPDDPETGAGGTMARYSLLHHDVVCLYLTRGEAGIRGKSPEESARIRTAEAESACRILGARPIFAGQIDGATEVNKARYDNFQNLLEGLQPDIVFTHFPVDTHRDHRAVSMLVFDNWQRTKRKFLLYYFEVLTGEQTQNFNPTDYVDITATESLKRKSCFAHESQGPAEMYAYHEKMSRFRGMECRVEHAEAFVSYSLNGQAGSVLEGL
jgi:LmbE family N-acetylglucosaminyl deacetylase